MTSAQAEAFGIVDKIVERRTSDEAEDGVAKDKEKDEAKE